MIYTAIDNFYLSEEELKDSPSRKDGIDEETETTLRIYGCDLIQESGILLKLPQAVMATGQVLFHRFYCKKSFARFSVKRVAASCVWLASKLEESPRRSKSVMLVFHRMECRRENLPVHHLDIHSKKFSDLKNDLIRMERHLLKEMGFICHVEHPHKFISNYLVTLEAPELTQEAWNLANDSLRTTLCVRFKSEVVACGVVYAAARRFCVPLPEEPLWCTAFDADEGGVGEVCRVLACLYSAPKAQYIPVYKDDDSFSVLVRNRKTPEIQPPKESPANAITDDSSTPNPNQAILSQEAEERLSDTKKHDDEAMIKTIRTEPKAKDEVETSKDDEVDVPSERIYEGEKERHKSRGRDREREREKEKDVRGRERERNSYRERERKRRHHHQRTKDKSSGHLENTRRHSSQDRGDYYCDKDRQRRNPY